MAEVTMPRLSDTMTEGTVAKWLKQPGDQVEKGEVLLEIETDKATMELPSYESGVMEQLLVQEGQTVAIGAPIARIGSGNGQQAEAPAAAAQPAPAEASAQTPPREQATPPAEDTDREAPTEDAAPSSSGSGSTALTEAPPAPGDEGRAAAPSVDERTAQAEGVADVGTVQESPPERAPSGQEDGVRPAALADDAEDLRASPMARRIARERGIDLHTIKGSGPGGRVIRADVEGVTAGANGAESASSARAERAAAQTPVPQPIASATSAEDAEEIPLSNIRRVTGRRMVESIQSAPHFFLTAVVDVTDLVALRTQVNERLATAGDTTKVSMNDLIVKACSVALREMPDVNVAFVDDKLYRKKQINIGIAVALENGLIVPVVRDVDQKSLGQVARESKALIDKARAGKLTPPDYTGGTFTVSNLGMFGIEHFTAVINTPEAAILAVGAVAAEPVAVQGKVEIRERMRLTLSVDHRALDGAGGARFLQRLKGILESPMRILI